VDFTVDDNASLLDGLSESYSVQLESFSGPLDLLLHLIRKNEVDVRDIPIADITKQYLDYIKLMKDLNLEVAGDFLLMASTLLHIKSRMLLPLEETDEDDGEDGDPRAELIRRLLEYQQYKEAGQLIWSRALLGREVFCRPCSEAESLALHCEDGPLELELFDLVDAFKALLDRIPKESFHEVAPGETFSIADCINEIMDVLQEHESVQFEEIVGEDLSRERVVGFFLALLELCKLRLIRIFQNGAAGSIWFVPAVVEESLESAGMET
jgi:segregation and condensation protein A